MKMQKYKPLLIGLMVLLVVFLCSCKAPGTEPAANRVSSTGYSVIDDKGTRVTLAEKPKRILTLSMSTDEILLGLVPPDHMVAVNHLLDDPASSNIVDVAQKVSIKINNPSVEEIIALHPDLVIFPDWGDLGQVASLRDVGVKVVVCKGVTNIAEIKETILLLAQAVGEEDRGTVLIAKMDKKLAEIKTKIEKLAPAKEKNVVLISLMQTYGGIGSTFDDACRHADVINGKAAAGIKNGQTMTKEQLVQINPDILLLPNYNNHGHYDVDDFTKEYLDDPALQTLTAIKTRQLVRPRDAYIYNASQNIVFGVQEIAYAAYGDTFKQPGNEHISAVE